MYFICKITNNCFICIKIALLRILISYITKIICSVINSFTKNVNLNDVLAHPINKVKELKMNETTV